MPAVAGWLVAASLSASPTPTDNTPAGIGLFFAFLAAIGVGSLLGSLATSYVNYINAKNDRNARREMAEREYQYRRGEMRLGQLREGFVSLVNAVLDLERWLFLIDFLDAESQQEAQRVLIRATGDFVKARAGLLLDQEGERIVRLTAELSRDAERYRAGLVLHQQLVQAAVPGGGGGEAVTEHSEQLRIERESMTRRIQQVIDEARAALDRMGGPPLQPAR